jgi:hypothetical protein
MKAKSATKANKNPKRTPKGLKVSTNVKAGGTNWGTNRCETLQRERRFPAEVTVCKLCGFFAPRRGN